MARLLGSAAILSVLAGGAVAGGVDRSGQSVAPIFEDGDYSELSFGTVAPSVSGTAVAGLGGFGSGDMAAGYTTFSAAYRKDLGNGFSGTVIFDQPFGADVDYPTGTNYYAQGSTAELRSYALTGILRYETSGPFSVHGGIRAQSFAAKAIVPFVSSYAAQGERDIGFGYLVGAAYERPEIALRVALTYNSAIDHSFGTAETTVALGGPNSSTTNVTTPQSVNLDFQTGVAADTLLFGSVRWVDWSEFDITPADYFTVTGGGSLVSYDEDRVTYTLGLGRRFSETWSGAVTLGYEEKAGGYSSNLGPTDGFASIGLAASYTKDNLEISGGVRYVMVGDAQTRITGFEPSANFNDNDAIGVGVRVAYTY